MVNGLVRNGSEEGLTRDQFPVYDDTLAPRFWGLSVITPELYHLGNVRQLLSVRRLY